MNDKIIVKGARENNLKNINIELPKNKLIVMTGVSGSGKSSLAFDTIYQEGQRRFVESLSSFARQFIGSNEKPDVDSIEGLSPAISIDQKSASHNPRSTVGTITEINTDVILDSLTLGYIPVISTIGFDHNGNLYNINADTAAARIAGALDAEKFIAMTDIKGVLKDKNDPNSLMQTINVSEIKQLAKQGIIDGGMLPKVACCEEAIRRGVNNVVIIDGRVPHSILIEVLTDEGVGTQFK